MTTRRFFSNNPPQVTLSSSITSGSTTVSAASFAGWQTNFPFFATLDIGTASAEIVSVTGISGSNATVVRGQGNTSAIGHPAGATFDMTAVALDYDEANLHTSSSSGVHGISGNVVGHNDVQTLTNKTLSNVNLSGTATGVNEHLTGTLTVDGATTLASNSVTGNEVVGGTIQASNFPVGPWTSYTPTVTQLTLRTATVTYAKYVQIGKTVIGSVVLTMTAAGALANPIVVSAPVAPAASVVNVGSFTFIPASGSRRAGSAIYSSGIQLQLDNQTGALGAAPSLALAVGDTIYISFSYEVA